MECPAPLLAPHPSRGAQQAERWGCDRPGGGTALVQGAPWLLPAESPPACLCQGMGAGAALCPPCIPAEPPGDPWGSRESQSTSRKLDRNERKRWGGAGARPRGDPAGLRLQSRTIHGTAPPPGELHWPRQSLCQCLCVHVRACMRVRRWRAAIPVWWSVSVGALCC